MPKEKQPLRPPHVPLEAEWVEEWKDWVVSLEGHPEKQALFRWWNVQDKYYGEFEGYKKEDKYIYNGYSKAFYENGELSYHEKYKHNTSIEEADFYRCTDSSQDRKIFSSFGKNVWSFKHIFDNGIVIATKYYTKDSKEVGIDGNPLPPRVGGIHKYANYMPDQERWFHGLRVKKFDKTLRIGLWQWWTKYGKGDAKEVYGNMEETKGKLVALGSNNIGYVLEKEAYYKNGNLKHKCVYEKNVDRYYKSYYEDGSIQKEVERHLTTGKFKTSKKHYQNGALEAYTEYYDDECTKASKYYYASGILKYEAEYDTNGWERYYKKYYENKSLQEEYQSQPRPHSRAYYEDGSLLAEKESFKREQKKCVFYYNHGSKQAEGFCDTDNVPNIDWKFYQGDGSRLPQQGKSTINESFSDIVKNKDKTDKQLLNHALFLYELKTMPLPDYLEGVNNIDWENKSSFFPSYNSHTPLYLKGLSSNKPGIINKSLANLEQYIFHQNTIDEITGYVIPFFIKILEHNKKAQKNILELLPYLMKDSYYGSDEKCDVLQKAAEGLSVYEKFLQSNDKKIKATAILLIATLPKKDGEENIKLLHHILPAEKDEIQIGNILWGLSLLMPQNDKRTSIIESYLKDKNPFLKFCGALAVLKIKRAQADKKIIDIIIKGMQSPKAIKKKYESLAFCEGTLESEMSVLFASSGQEVTDIILSHLIPAMKNQDLFSKFQLMKGMLMIVFGEEGHTGEVLTEDQRKVLECILECEEHEVRSVNLSDILENFGLPRQIEELKKILK